MESLFEFELTGERQSHLLFFHSPDNISGGSNEFNLFPQLLLDASESLVQQLLGILGYWGNSFVSKLIDS